MQGTRTYTPSQTSFFEEIATLLISLASFNAATESFANSSATRIPSTPEHTLNLYGRVVHASFQGHATMHGLVRNVWRSSLSVNLAPAPNSPPIPNNGIQLQGSSVANLVVQLVGTAFLKYYERNAHRPKAAHPQGPRTWPDLWRFAWLLRNAIAHGDRWSIADPSLPPTAWHGITVDSSANGMPWFDLNRFLGGGDILLLLEELDASTP
jgi:hypothetical protein